MPDKSYLPEPTPRQKLTPEKPNTCAGTSVTTFSWNLTLPISLETINFISLTE